MVIVMSEVGEVARPAQLWVRDHVVLGEAASLNITDRRGTRTDAVHSIRNAIAAIPEKVAGGVRRLTGGLQTRGCGQSTTSSGTPHQHIRDIQEVSIGQVRPKGAKTTRSSRRSHSQLCAAESIHSINHALRRPIVLGNTG